MTDAQSGLSEQLEEVLEFIRNRRWSDAENALLLVIERLVDDEAKS